MYNADTELLYPMRVTSSLRNVRDEKWTDLIDHVIANDCTTNDQLAFTLMMVKLDGCVNCNTDSFRAMRGCTQCAKQNIKRFRGDDNELFEQYEQAKIDVEKYLSTRPL
jgi:hypothetical protein